MTEMSDGWSWMEPGGGGRSRMEPDSAGWSRMAPDGTLQSMKDMSYDI